MGRSIRDQAALASDTILTQNKTHMLRGHAYYLCPQTHAISFTIKTRTPERTQEWVVLLYVVVKDNKFENRIVYCKSL